MKNNSSELLGTRMRIAVIAVKLLPLVGGGEGTGGFRIFFFIGERLLVCFISFVVGVSSYDQAAGSCLTSNKKNQNFSSSGQESDCLVNSLPQNKTSTETGKER